MPPEISLRILDFVIFHSRCWENKLFFFAISARGNNCMAASINRKYSYIKTIGYDFARARPRAGLLDSANTA
jgi:hypothetical protein